MSNKRNYAAIRQRYEQLAKGQQADLKRATDPYEDLPLRPAYYALMGAANHEANLRVAFLMPWIPHREGADTLGQALAKAGISEKRLFQVVRSEGRNALIQLRRLVQHVEPVVDWNRVGNTLYYWNEQSRRTLLEQFYTTAAESETEPKGVEA